MVSSSLKFLVEGSIQFVINNKTNSKSQGCQIFITQFKLREISFLDQKVRIITLFHQPHLQLTVAQHLCIYFLNFFQQNLFGIGDADSGNAERQAQCARDAQISTIVGKTTRPILVNLSIELRHIYFILLPIDKTLNLMRECSIIPVGYAVNKLDPSRLYSHHFSNCLQFLVVFVTFKPHVPIMFVSGSIQQQQGDMHKMPLIHSNSDKNCEEFTLFKFLENYKRGIEIYNSSRVRKHSTIATSHNIIQKTADLHNLSLQINPQVNLQHKQSIQIKRTKNLSEKLNLPPMLAEKKEESEEESPTTIIKKSTKTLKTMEEIQVKSAFQRMINNTKKSMKVKRVYGRNEIKGVVFRSRRKLKMKN